VHRGVRRGSTDFVEVGLDAAQFAVDRQERILLPFDDLREFLALTDRGSRPVAERPEQHGGHSPGIRQGAGQLRAELAPEVDFEGFAVFRSVVRGAHHRVAVGGFDAVGDGSP
jgi:hypothetical protein